MFLRFPLARFVLLCGLVVSLLALPLPAYAAQPTATVVARTLNVRSGPGTNYSVIASATKGMRLGVIGQYNNCTWIKVVDSQKQEGWLAGTSQYVSIDTPCKQIPVAAPPANTPPAAAPTTKPAAPAQPANQGCFLFQNQMGVEVTLTFTAQSGNGSKTFKVAKHSDQEQCFVPGKYTYTLDAPPPWNSVNGALTINAGDRYTFPISGK